MEFTPNAMGSDLNPRAPQFVPNGAMTAELSLSANAISAASLQHSHQPDWSDLFVIDSQLGEKEEVYSSFYHPPHRSVEPNRHRDRKALYER